MKREEGKLSAAVLGVLRPNVVFWIAMERKDERVSKRVWVCLCKNSWT